MMCELYISVWVAMPAVLSKVIIAIIIYSQNKNIIIKKI